jgi:hypothetical protein
MYKITRLTTSATPAQGRFHAIWFAIAVNGEADTGLRFFGQTVVNHADETYFSDAHLMLDGLSSDERQRYEEDFGLKSGEEMRAARQVSERLCHFVEGGDAELTEVLETIPELEFEEWLTEL